MWIMYFYKSIQIIPKSRNNNNFLNYNELLIIGTYKKYKTRKCFKMY